MDRMSVFKSQASKMFGFGGTDQGYIGENVYYGGGNGGNKFNTAMPDTSRLGKLPSYDRTLTFVIANASETDVEEAILFGENRYDDNASGGNITIDVQQSSHRQVRRDSQANPFLIVGYKVKTTTEGQLSNPWTIELSQTTGSLETYQSTPFEYASAQNQTPTQVDALGWELGVSGRIALKMNVEPNETVRIIFAATASPTTPTGLYTVTANFVATSTF